MVALGTFSLIIIQIILLINFLRNSSKHTQKDQNEAKDPIDHEEENAAIIGKDESILAVARDVYKCWTDQNFNISARERSALRRKEHERSLDLVNLILSTDLEMQHFEKERTKVVQLKDYRKDDDENDK